MLTFTVEFAENITDEGDFEVVDVNDVEFGSQDLNEILDSHTPSVNYHPDADYKFAQLVCTFAQTDATVILARFELRKNKISDGHVYRWCVTSPA